MTAVELSRMAWSTSRLARSSSSAALRAVTSREEQWISRTAPVPGSRTVRLVVSNQM
jgi:hypothetical protein